jgi:hypothetical protein
MHDIEPYYAWRHLYIASEDKFSPFYKREYSEFEFTHAVYNYLIHPQWDEIGSSTLYLKILFVNYDEGFAIIELFGEWNDVIHNDIMYLKRNVADALIMKGVTKFILIGEHVFNFHALDDDYYQEWFDDIEEGWIVALNFRDHNIREFKRANLDYYIAFGGKFDHFNWRGFEPNQLFHVIDALIMKRLNP